MERHSHFDFDQFLFNSFGSAIEVSKNSDSEASHLRKLVKDDLRALLDLLNSAHLMSKMSSMVKIDMRKIADNVQQFDCNTFNPGQFN